MVSITQLKLTILFILITLLTHAQVLIVDRENGQDSIQKKIEVIRECNLSHYLDDLLKIFLMDDYPKYRLKSFLFKPTSKIPDWLLPLDSFESLIDQIE